MPGIYDLFNVTTHQNIVQPAPGAPAAQPDQSQGVFLTPQSLVTFPGATAAGLLISRVVDKLVPAVHASVWVPFVIALVLGAFIWWIGISDPAADQSKRYRVMSAGIALINSLQIFASLLGLPNN
jgi:hypothetical protein